jgi:hypothetical protein
LSCLWYAFWPPWWTGHDRTTIDRLSAEGWRAAFLRGLREHPDRPLEPEQ